MLRAALAALAVLAAAACGGGEPDGRLTVLAAASLTEVLPEVDPEPRYSFAGSDALATQIREGAPADVYIAASLRHPGELLAEGLIGQPTAFARNRLVIAVPSGNPASIKTARDIAKSGVRLVMAAPGVPAGDYARSALRALGEHAALENVVSFEDDVKGVVGKVALGEVDAGIVYATDIARIADVAETIEIPDWAQPSITYLGAVVADSPNGQRASEYIEHLLSGGAAALEAAGFRRP